MDKSLSINGGYFFRYNDTPETIHSLAVSNEFWERVGSFAANSIASRSYFVKQETIATEHTLIEKANIHKHFVYDFLSSLWLVKDNSCNAIRVLSDCYFPEREWSNSLNINSTHLYTTSSCVYSEVTFNLEEIKLAAYYHELVNKLIPPVPGFDLTEMPTMNPGGTYRTVVSSQVDYSKFSRLHRAQHFLKQARESLNLLDKISFYVIILECLFSTENSGEVAHKVSERAASYLSGNPKERIQLIKTIKTYYGIRSKYVHGQNIPFSQRTHLDYVNHSKELDSLIRNIFVKIITTNETRFLSKEDKVLNDWFQELIFNLPSDSEEDQVV